MANALRSVQEEERGVSRMEEASGMLSEMKKMMAELRALKNGTEIQMEESDCSKRARIDTE